MTPEEYNSAALKAGRFGHDDIADLVRHWQEEQGLLIDGKLGTNTLDSLHAWSDVEETTPLEGLDDGSYLMLKALELNLAEVGQGETEANNRGERIDYYRKTDGTGIGPGAQGPWCATLQSSSLMRASAEGKIAMPCRTSRSSRRLGNQIGHAGRFLNVPEAGCLVIWQWGSNPRKGHIGQCVTYDPTTDTLYTVEGNKNRPGENRAFVGEFVHPNGKWRRRLYCLSTLSSPVT